MHPLILPAEPQYRGNCRTVSLRKCGHPPTLRGKARSAGPAHQFGQRMRHGR